MSRSQAILPLDADNEDESGFGRHVVRALLLAQASQTDLLALGLTILLDILLGPLENNAALLFVGLFDFESAVYYT